MLGAKTREMLSVYLLTNLKYVKITGPKNPTYNFLVWVANT
jgi:hypothetical protein